MEQTTIKLNKNILLIGVLAAIFLLLSGIGRVFSNLNKAAKIPEGLEQEETIQSSPKSTFQPQESITYQPLTYNYMLKDITLIGTITQIQAEGKSFTGFKSKYPLNIFSTQENRLGTDQKNITDLQFVNVLNLPTDRFLEKEVQVTGNFMAAHTAHHLTPVLFELSGTSLYNGQKDGSLTGFYTHYDKMDWGDVPVTCDAFTVTDGDQSLITDFKNTVLQGNNLNYIDSQNRLVLNLNLDRVDAEIRKIITTSTPGSPVEIGVYKPDLILGQVPACYSLVQIVFAK
jgi:hypothetical protein